MKELSASVLAFCTREHAYGESKAMVTRGSVEGVPRQVLQEASVLAEPLAKSGLVQKRDGESLEFGDGSSSRSVRATMRFDEVDGGCLVSLTLGDSSPMWAELMAWRGLPADESSGTPLLRCHLSAQVAVAEHTYGRSVSRTDLQDAQPGDLASRIRQMAYDLCRGYATVVLCRTVLSATELAAARFSLCRGTFACWLALGWDGDLDRVDSVVKRVVLPELRWLHKDHGAAQFVADSLPFYMGWSDAMLPFGDRDAISVFAAVGRAESRARPALTLEMLAPPSDRAIEGWQGRVSQRQLAEIVARLDSPE